MPPLTRSRANAGPTAPPAAAAPARLPSPPSPPFSRSSSPAPPPPKRARRASPVRPQPPQSRSSSIQPDSDSDDGASDEDGSAYESDASTASSASSPASGELSDDFELDVDSGSEVDSSDDEFASAVQQGFEAEGDSDEDVDELDDDADLSRPTSTRSPALHHVPSPVASAPAAPVAALKPTARAFDEAASRRDSYSASGMSLFMAAASPSARQAILADGEAARDEAVAEGCDPQQAFERVLERWTFAGNGAAYKVTPYQLDHFKLAQEGTAARAALRKERAARLARAASDSGQAPADADGTADAPLPRVPPFPLDLAHRQLSTDDGTFADFDAVDLFSGDFSAARILELPEFARLVSAAELALDKGETPQPVQLAPQHVAQCVPSHGFLFHEKNPDAPEAHGDLGPTSRATRAGVEILGEGSAWDAANACDGGAIRNVARRTRNEEPNGTVMPQECILLAQRFLLSLVFVPLDRRYKIRLSTVIVGGAAPAFVLGASTHCGVAPSRRRKTVNVFNYPFTVHAMKHRRFITSLSHKKVAYITLQHAIILERVKHERASSSSSLVQGSRSVAQPPAVPKGTATRAPPPTQAPLEPVPKPQQRRPVSYLVSYLDSTLPDPKPATQDPRLPPSSTRSARRVDSSALFGGSPPGARLPPSLFASFPYPASSPQSPYASTSYSTASAPYYGGFGALGGASVGSAQSASTFYASPLGLGAASTSMGPPASPSPYPSAPAYPPQQFSSIGDPLLGAPHASSSFDASPLGPGVDLSFRRAPGLFEPGPSTSQQHPQAHSSIGDPLLGAPHASSSVYPSPTHAFSQPHASYAPSTTAPFSPLSSSYDSPRRDLKNTQPGAPLAPASFHASPTGPHPGPPPQHARYAPVPGSRSSAPLTQAFGTAAGATAATSAGQPSRARASGSVHPRMASLKRVDAELREQQGRSTRIISFEKTIRCLGLSPSASSDQVDAALAKKIKSVGSWGLPGFAPRSNKVTTGRKSTSDSYPVKLAGVYRKKELARIAEGGGPYSKRELPPVVAHELHVYHAAGFDSLGDDATRMSSVRSDGVVVVGTILEVLMRTRSLKAARTRLRNMVEGQGHVLEEGQEFGPCMICGSDSSSQWYRDPADYRNRRCRRCARHLHKYHVERPTYYDERSRVQRDQDPCFVCRTKKSSNWRWDHVDPCRRRCHTCSSYYDRHGVDRPPELIVKRKGRDEGRAKGVRQCCSCGTKKSKVWNWNQSDTSKSVCENCYEYRRRFGENPSQHVLHLRDAREHADAPCSICGKKPAQCPDENDPTIRRCTTCHKSKKVHGVDKTPEEVQKLVTRRAKAAAKKAAEAAKKP
ncbi:hypothetical protein JCM8208_001768 [Rhodotorula glutinis]